MTASAAEASPNLQGAGPVNPEPTKPARQRIDSIDLLRGIVMVLMVLDHMRDFVHTQGLFGDPTNLQATTVPLFLTRWITHFCAPVFVFLAGTGAYLQFMRGKSKKQLSRFLVTRGFWLIFLELTLVKFGAFFSLDIRMLGALQVIWVIGVSMIVLAGLIHLPLKVTAAFGLSMIALHNLFDRFQVVPWQGPQSPVPGAGAKVWMLLHQQGAFPIAGFPSPLIYVAYPLIPWVGVMAVGYAFGALYKLDKLERRRGLLMIGGIATALFFALRAVNLYGDPAKWSSQKNYLFTALSFLNTTKYPPSLLFLLMTLGPALIALAWFELPGWIAATRSLIDWLRGALVMFGRVPLFFYILQWYMAHSIGIIAGLIAGQSVRHLYESPLDRFSHPPPQGVGFRLWVVYLCWIIGVALLYPLCKWFAGVKARRRDWWLSYL